MMRRRRRLRLRPAPVRAGAGRPGRLLFSVHIRVGRRRRRRHPGGGGRGSLARGHGPGGGDGGSDQGDGGGSSDSSPPTADSPSNSVTDCKFARAVPGASSWQVEERTCTPISCGSYVPPANGAVSPTGERTYGQTVTITCNTGYELTTDERYSSTPSCQANGVFTTGKQCHQTPCGSDRGGDLEAA